MDTTNDIHTDTWNRLREQMNTRETALLLQLQNRLEEASAAFRNAKDKIEMNRHAQEVAKRASALEDNLKGLLVRYGHRRP